MTKIILAIIITIITLVFTISFIAFTLKSIFNPMKRAPYIGTQKRHTKLMKQINITKNATILDLGCGDGKALRFFNDTYKIKKGVGYDINPYVIIRGKIINKVKGNKNISLYHKNFLDIKIKGYKYIYIYLRPSQLIDIEDRIREKKDKNSIVISNSFQFKKHKTYQTIKNNKGKKFLFFYK